MGNNQGTQQVARQRHRKIVRPGAPVLTHGDLEAKARTVQHAPRAGEAYTAPDGPFMRRLYMRPNWTRGGR